ncbi:hypothetical protein CHS0354_040545, partial [Potamilus streckersoni]
MFHVLHDIKLNDDILNDISIITNLLSGTCSYWVGAIEDGADDDWVDLNGNPIPTTPGIYFIDSADDTANDAGLMSKNSSFLLVGEN